MKTTKLLFTLLALLGMTQAAAQEYEYVPFVREGVKWVYRIYNDGGFYPTDPSVPEGRTYMKLEFKGDTTINGKIYKAMHKYHGDTINREHDTIPIYMREENKVVYGIVPDGRCYADCPIGIWEDHALFEKMFSGEEFILYDFNDPITFCKTRLKTDSLLYTDVISIGKNKAKRYVFNYIGDFSIVEGIGYSGYSSYTLFLWWTPEITMKMKLPNRESYQEAIFSLSYVVEDGEIIYTPSGNQPTPDPEPSDYEYVPFVREGVKWTYAIDDYRFFADYETIPARGDNTVYRTLELRGDTIIDGKTYKAMHKCVDDEYSEPSDVIVLYLREEDKMVYGIVPDNVLYDDATLINGINEQVRQAIALGNEFLLYDFQDPFTYWDNLVNYELHMDTIEVGGHCVKRVFDGRHQEGDDFQVIEGIGAMGMNSYPLCFIMPVGGDIHGTEYYSLVKVEEDGAVIYPHPGYAEDRYMPLIREGVKWIYEKVTIQGGDTICQYYTYEFKGNHPEKTDYDCVCKALYRYDGQQHDLDVENDTIVAGMMENEAIIKSYFNEPMKQVVRQDRNMINLGTEQQYTLYLMGTNYGWLGCYYYYVMNQKESFLNDATFVKTDPIMIDGYQCSRLAYLDEQGDTVAYVVEGIGFDSRDMGDLLTPFTRKPDPNADYQEWCGLSHVIKDGKIIYKGMCYHPIEIPGDVNGDGEITVADANSVIDVVIMGGNASHPRIPIDEDGNYIGDVNGDGEVTIADVNAIIDMILNNN